MRGEQCFVCSSQGTSQGATEPAQPPPKRIIWPIDDVLEAFGMPLSNQPNATIGMQRSESGTLLEALLRPSTRTYLEWGSGGSTDLISWLILAGRMHQDFRAFSIESSLSWIEGMRTRSPLVRQAERTGSLTFVHGSLGPTRALGYPRNFSRSDHARSRRYVSLPEKLRGRRVDVALVDGRFRLACALEIYKHLSSLEDGRQPVVLLHDYAIVHPGLTRQRFDYYSRALEFYHLVRRNYSLATLVPKRCSKVVDRKCSRWASLASLENTLETALGSPER